MQVRNKWGIAIALLALIVALLQFLANRYFLYWEFWWFDIVMHFLGGLLVALTLFWGIRFEVPPVIRNFFPPFAVVFLGTLLVGVAWELFEYTFGIYGGLTDRFDTASDLGMNTVGMFAAYLLFNRVCPVGQHGIAQTN